MTKLPKTNMQNTFIRFKGESEAFIVCGPTEPDGDLGVSYQGDREQLTEMALFLLATLKAGGMIGDLPNR